ncbi:adenine phosphoribosyltransferase [Pseudoglutamicibacter albus]|uniref:adenine phosphoribosyltransferase n=1 Tax=Pseudoglutamicibacter albus TaxID=98671 RepID=UPI001E57EEA9|nr:adenine phosphoribosyltransferase [Pseudoglutamicibacter albus]
MSQPAQMRERTQAGDAASEPRKPVEEPVGESIERLLDRLCAIIPDHPEPGITFRDLTPVFADAEGLHRVVDALAEPFAGQFDAVAGLEARGFLLASAVAYAAGVGLMTVRKGGKLPREVYSREYQLEYGTASLEVHRDALPKGGRVLLVDDVLATGGTAAAAASLVEQVGGTVAGVAVVLELDGLGGREKLDPWKVHALQRV